MLFASWVSGVHILDRNLGPQAWAQNHRNWYPTINVPVRPCFSASEPTMFQILVSVSPLVFIIVFFAVRGGHGKEGNIFQDNNTGVTLNYVSNSGICEQTPGVGQYSGYADFGNNNVIISFADLALS